MQQKKEDLQEGVAEQTLVMMVQEARHKIEALIQGPYCTKRLEPYLTAVQEEGVPYLDYEEEPRQVRQIKDIINALHYVAFIASKLDSNWTLVSNGASIYKAAVKAAEHLTYLDVDVFTVFSREISLIIATLDKVQAVVTEHQQDVDVFAKKTSESLSSYTIGKIVGTGVKQLDPKAPRLDYPFLTQFSADLPGYIQKMTETLQDYAKTAEEVQPQIDKEKIAELKDGAVQLLQAIEVIQQSAPIALPFHLLHYITIIKQVATLLMATVDEIGLMNQASQTVICTYIRELKYTLLPQLFAEVDKVEDQFLLSPGTLSDPLMQKITGFYQRLIQYAGMVVQFSDADAAYLVELNDRAFVEKRMANIKMRNLALRAQVRVHALVEKDLEVFLDEANSLDNIDKPLIEFDETSKKKMIEAYKSLHPFVEKFSPDLHNQIVQGLTDVPELAKEQRLVEELDDQSEKDQSSWSESLWTPFKKAYTWWKSEPSEGAEDNDQSVPDEKPSFDIISSMKKFYGWFTGEGLVDWQKLQTQLKPMIAREIATQNFHLVLNEDLLHKINASVPPVLSHAEQTQDPFFVDEQACLTQAGFIKEMDVFEKDEYGLFLCNTGQLDINAAFYLAEVYQERITELNLAKADYQYFLTRAKAFIQDSNSSYAIAPLSKAYFGFQPWLKNHIVGCMPEQSILDFFANPQDIPLDSINMLQPLIDIEGYVLETFDEAALHYEQFRDNYIQLAQAKIASKELTLSTEDVSRSNYLLKHTKYSKAIRIFRSKLDALTDIFMEEVQTQLKLSSLDASPFIELEEVDGRLSQSQQLIGIKGFLKALYHLEQSVLQLEKLNTTSTQATFLFHFSGLKNDAQQLANLATVLYEDPYLGQVFKDWFVRFQDFQKEVLEDIDPYLAKPDEKVYAPASNALWLGMQAFLLAPQKMQAHREGRILTSVEAQEVQDRAISMVRDIERIISNAGSYFNLFLELPTFYQLFYDLKAQLNYFSGMSYDYIVDYLEDIQELLNRLVLEADTLELHFGLKHGFLSAVFEEVITQFFKGMVDALALDPKQSIALFTSFNSLLARKQATTDYYQNGWMQVEMLQMELDILNDFLVRVTQWEHAYETEEKKQLLVVLQSAYVDVCPLLEESKHIKTFDQALDDLDEALQDGVENPFNQIKARVKTASAYKAGLLATERLRKNAVDAKRAYLDSLIDEKHETNAQLKRQYAEKAVMQCLEEKDDEVPFIHTKMRYQNRINRFILCHKEDIIRKSLQNPDIFAHAKSLTQAKKAEFNQAERHHFDDLEAFIAALNAFEQYLLQAEEEIKAGVSYLFEDLTTIREKKEIIKQFKEVIDNKHMSITQCLTELRGRFCMYQLRLLNAYKVYESWSFDWFLSCIARFFEAICLYTSDTAGHVQQLGQKSRFFAPKDNAHSFFHSEEDSDSSLELDTYVGSVDPSGLTESFYSWDSDAEESTSENTISL